MQINKKVYKIEKVGFLILLLVERDITEIVAFLQVFLVIIKVQVPVL